MISSSIKSTSLWKINYGNSIWLRMCACARTNYSLILQLNELPTNAVINYSARLAFAHKYLIRWVRRSYQNRGVLVCITYGCKLLAFRCKLLAFLLIKFEANVNTWGLDSKLQADSKILETFFIYGFTFSWFITGVKRRETPTGRDPIQEQTLTHH